MTTLEKCFLLAETHLIGQLRWKKVSENAYLFLGKRVSRGNHRVGGLVYASILIVVGDDAMFRYGIREGDNEAGTWLRTKPHAGGTNESQTKKAT